MSDRNEVLRETCFSLGSNLGNRLARLRQAKVLILLEPQVIFVDQSPIYETEPIGVNPEYESLKFLNAALIVQSPYTAEEWLIKIQTIEERLRRVRTEERNAPRSIDVDIIFSGDETIVSDRLRVPHPRWAERRFVVQPLADIRPERVLPGAKSSVGEVLAQLGREEDVRFFAERW